MSEEIGSMNEIAAEAAAAAGEIKGDETISTSLSEINEANPDDLDIEVESAWDKDPEPLTPVEGELENQEIDVPQVETITFPANGKEEEISIEDARKRLSMDAGSRKWTSDKDKLSRTLKERDVKIESLSKYKESWDKLEEVRHDKSKLFNLITGDDYNTFIDREVAKRELYKNGSEDEKRIMEQDSRIQELEARNERDRAEIKKRQDAAEATEYEAEKIRMHNLMTEEFRKYDIGEVAPEVGNRLKKMLWQQSVAELKLYKNKYGKLTPQMYEKAFRENASALQKFTQEKVEVGVDKEIRSKKESAKTNAQLASTRNYKKVIPSNVTRQDPMSIFNNIFRKDKK